jgi:hypothetical protein
MFPLHSAATILLILIPFLAEPALGQTNMKDRPTCLSRNDQLNPSIAYPTQTGMTITVWEDERDDPLTGSDIYIQSIDNATGVSEWIGDVVNNDVVTDRFDGIAVCRAEQDQRNPRAAYDGMGGVIVVWEDYRNDPIQSVADIYAQRIILATGRPDPTWPADGIAVCQTGFHAERPRIVGTVDGAFITWIDYRNDPGSSPRDRDVFVQYIQSTTASWPQPPTNWVQNGIQVATNTKADQINPELDTDNILVLDLLGTMTQGVVVTYQDNRYTGAYSGLPVWTVFANRIDANGVQMYTMGVPPWIADAPAGPSYEHQEFPRIVTTGKLPNVTNQSAIIVWQDAIADPVNGITDIFAQRLDATGLPMLGGATGLPVCQEPMSQILPQPVLWESGDPLQGTYIPYVTVGWLDYRDYALNGIDIYAGLIMANVPGVMINPLGPAGQPVCTEPNDQIELSMDNLFVSNAITEYTVFAWNHDLGAFTDIWTQKISLPTWIESWPTNGWPVTQAKNNQLIPQVNREVYVWQDGRREAIPGDSQDDENIYCQTPGTCTGGTEMLWRDAFAKWSPGEDARNFRFVADLEDGSTYVVWDEIRYPYAAQDPHRIVFIQKLDKDGVPRWANGGVAVSNYLTTIPSPPYTRSALLADVCLDWQNGAWVIWQQESYATQRNECPMRRVDFLGVPGTPKLELTTWNEPSLSFITPRLITVNSASGSLSGGGIAGMILREASNGDRVPFLVRFDQNGDVLNMAAVGNLGLVNHEDIRVSFDGRVHAYALTRSDSKIVVSWWDVRAWGKNQVAIDYSSFGGYDLYHQDHLRVQNAALFTYSIATTPNGPHEVYLGAYRENEPANSVFTYQVTNYGPDCNSTLPVLAPDSVGQNYPHLDFGELLAWDSEYLTPWGYYHRVETNRYRFTGGTYPSLIVTPEFFPPLLLESGLTRPTYPDIARVVNTNPTTSPHAVVVWEGGDEFGGCSPPRPTDIRGQFVAYDASISPPTLWIAPTSIAPGPGNYHQQRPQVAPGIPGDVSVYWYDGQLSNTAVMGTRLPELGASIAWAKSMPPTDTKPALDRAAFIDNIWPQPSSATSDVINIRVRGNAQAAHATLELYDLLGRQRALLFEGSLDDGGRIILLQPDRHGLETGNYLLVLRTSGSQVTRRITITR